MPIKEWIELTLYELADEILFAKNKDEIKRALDTCAEELYLAQNCDIENEKNS